MKITGKIEAMDLWYDKYHKEYTLTCSVNKQSKLSIKELIISENNLPLILESFVALLDSLEEVNR